MGISIINGDIIDLFQTLKTGTQTTTGTPTVLTGWTTAIGRNSGTPPCTLDSGTGQVTMDKTGWYTINVWVNGDGATSNRSQLIIQLQNDVGSGFVNVPGASDDQYARRDALQTTGSAQFHNFMVEYTAGDIIRVMVSDIQDEMDIDSDESRISISYYGL